MLVWDSRPSSISPGRFLELTTVRARATKPKSAAIKLTGCATGRPSAPISLNVQSTISSSRVTAGRTSAQTHDEADGEQDDPQHPQHAPGLGIDLLEGDVGLDRLPAALVALLLRGRALLLEPAQRQPPLSDQEPTAEQPDPETHGDDRADAREPRLAAAGPRSRRSRRGPARRRPARRSGMPRAGSVAASTARPRRRERPRPDPRRANARTPTRARHRRSPRPCAPGRRWAGRDCG